MGLNPFGRGAKPPPVRVQAMLGIFEPYVRLASENSVIQKDKTHITKPYSETNENLA